MKKIILFVLVAVLIGGKVSGQVKVLGNLTTNGPATYPTHIDSLGYSGYRVVKDLTERDAISTQRRKLGMMVFVQSNDSIYVLKDAALGNGNWANLGTLLSISASSLGQLSSLSVSGMIEGGTFSGTLSSSAQRSITAVGSLQDLTVINSINAASIIASGAITAVDLNGTRIGGTLTSAAQPNITSVGQLSQLSVSGMIEGGVFSGTLAPGTLSNVTSLGNLQQLTVTNSINAGNITVSGTVTADTFSGVNVKGVLQTAAQPNITSVGRLGNLSVSGTIEGGIFSGTLSPGTLNNVTSLGNLQQLTVANSINAANITVSGTVTAGLFSGTLNAATQNSITSLANVQQLTVANSINAANITVSGTVTAGLLSGSLNVGAQNSITSLANVQSLTVVKSISAANITVSGTVTSGVLSSNTVQSSRYLANINNVTVATNVTIDLSQGNVISLPMTTSTTLAFSNAPTSPASYVFKVSYSSASAFTITWPAAVKWSGNTPPTLTCASGKVDVINLIWDGMNYYGTYALNF